MSTSFSPRKSFASPSRSRTSSRAPSRVSSRRPSLAAYDAAPVSAADSVALLTDASNFQDLPSTDPLTSLLVRYVPNGVTPRHNSAEWRGRSLEELVTTGSWRAVATYARDMLISRSHTEVADILELWHIRLHALLRLQLVNLHTRELVTLDRHLSRLPNEMALQTPFEIEVFRAKMQDTATTAAHSGQRGAPLLALMRKCQLRARSELDDEERQVWRGRSTSVGMLVVGSLVERKEYVTALGVLDGISLPSANEEKHQHATVQIQMVRFLIHLSLGTLHHAQTLLEEMSNDTSVTTDVMKRVLGGLLRTCQGRFSDAQGSAPLEGQETKRLDMVVANNEAVALLSNGELSEAVARLRTAMESHEPDCYSEPYIFNLATLYELDGGSALHNKVKVLENAVRATGDLIKPGAFKLI